QRLVPASAVSSASPTRVCPLETPDGIWQMAAVSGEHDSRSLAVRRMASHSRQAVMALPVKHSIAVGIYRGTQVLAVRRPENDDELPGIWGLPAGSFRSGETVNDLIRRIGSDKLGTDLVPVRKLASGSQSRSAYRIEMELWEASMDRTPIKAE